MPSTRNYRRICTRVEPFENKSDMRTCAIGNLNIHQSVHCWRCWDLFPDRDKLVTEKSESSLWSSCWQWSTYLSSKKVTSWLWQIRGDCGFFLATTSTVTLAGSRVWPSQLPQSSHLKYVLLSCFVVRWLAYFLLKPASINAPWNDLQLT